MTVFLFEVHGGEPFGNSVSKKELPEGTGLAIPFKADADIQKDPAVIFADGFESGEMAQGWEDLRNQDGKVLSFAEPGLPELGKRCLRVEAHLDHDMGGGFTKWFESSETIFIRFYTKFDPSCDYVHHYVTLRANKGLHGVDRWSGFGQARLLPAGDDRFSTAIEPWGSDAQFSPPGKWNMYSYWPEMKKSGDGKYWGNSFFAPEISDTPRDRWICVEFMLKHNTPGQPDGEQAFWIDGVLVGHWKGQLEEECHALGQCLDLGKLFHGSVDQKPGQYRVFRQCGHRPEIHRARQSLSFS